MSRELAGKDDFSATETKSFIETARNIFGRNCGITVDILGVHYWNCRTNSKKEKAKWH